MILQSHYLKLPKIMEKCGSKLYRFFGKNFQVTVTGLNYLKKQTITEITAGEGRSLSRLLEDPDFKLSGLGGLSGTKLAGDFCWRPGMNAPGIFCTVLCMPYGFDRGGKVTEGGVRGDRLDWLCLGGRSGGCSLL